MNYSFVSEKIQLWGTKFGLNYLTTLFEIIFCKCILICLVLRRRLVRFGTFSKFEFKKAVSNIQVQHFSVSSSKSISTESFFNGSLLKPFETSLKHLLLSNSNSMKCYQTEKLLEERSLKSPLRMLLNEWKAKGREPHHSIETKFLHKTLSFACEIIMQSINAANCSFGHLFFCFHFYFELKCVVNLNASGNFLPKLNVNRCFSLSRIKYRQWACCKDKTLSCFTILTISKEILISSLQKRHKRFRLIMQNKSVQIDTNFQRKKRKITNSVRDLNT